MGFSTLEIGTERAGPSGLAELEQLHVKESSLILTLRSENLADISTECISFHQGKLISEDS